MKQTDMTVFKKLCKHKPLKGTWRCTDEATFVILKYPSYEWTTITGSVENRYTKAQFDRERVIASVELFCENKVIVDESVVEECIHKNSWQPLLEGVHNSWNAADKLFLTGAYWEHDMYKYHKYPRFYQILLRTIAGVGSSAPMQLKINSEGVQQLWNSIHSCWINNEWSVKLDNQKQIHLTRGKGEWIPFSLFDLFCSILDGTVIKQIEDAEKEFEENQAIQRAQIQRRKRVQEQVN